MQRFCLVCAALLLTSLFADAAQHRSNTPQEVFDSMHASFHPEKARGVHARYQFTLSGAKGGAWWIEVSDGKCRFGRGAIHNPDVTFLASDQDWVALSNGTLNGTWAYLTGRLKIHGPHALARKLDEMF